MPARPRPNDHGLTHAQEMLRRRTAREATRTAHLQDLAQSVAARAHFRAMFPQEPRK